MPATMREIIVVLADRVRRLNGRVEDFVFRDLPGRLARLLTMYVGGRNGPAHGRGRPQQ